MVYLCWQIHFSYCVHACVAACFRIHAAVLGCFSSLHFLILYIPLMITWNSVTETTTQRSLMHHEYISQCHLSPGLKMTWEIKPCLTGSVIDATPNSCNTATAAVAPFCILSPSLLLLSYSLPWDMACTSSTEQRKPKTRKILLKGVSKQPDINNLHVYRAESKPLGICGFTWVCECGSVCVPAFTPSTEHTSSCILSPICAIKHSQCLIWNQIS